MFTCWDGKGGKLSSQASKMYKPPGAVYIKQLDYELETSIALYLTRKQHESTIV